MSLMGNASGQRVKRSMTVRRYWQPWDSESGPTMSMWTCSNLPLAGAKVWIGVLVCLWTLKRWQLRHDWAHLVTSLLRPCQTNLDAMSLFVVLAPGCARAWAESKIFL